MENRPSGAVPDQTAKARAERYVNVQVSPPYPRKTTPVVRLWPKGPTADAREGGREAEAKEAEPSGAATEKRILTQLK